MTTDRTPATEAAEGMTSNEMRRLWPKNVEFIEAQAIDARVAAAVEAASDYIAARSGVGEGDTVVTFQRLIDVVADLTTLAAERDERLRREGWDAALVAVDRGTAHWPKGDRRRLLELYDRLASEGPR